MGGQPNPRERQPNSTGPTTDASDEAGFSRRDFLQATGGTLALAGVGQATAADDSAGEYICGIEPSVGAAAVTYAAESVEREIEFGDIGSAVAGTYTPEAIEDLRDRWYVRYAEPNGTVEATDAGSPVEAADQMLPWGIDRVDADLAYEDGLTGAGAHIAVLDTGVDGNHPDIEHGIGESESFVADCTGAACDPLTDTFGHGTHVAGIAAARENDRAVVGVAPEATVHAGKVLGPNGAGKFSWVADGIRWAADQGYDVINMSLGADESNQVMKDAVEYASKQGISIIAAAGNDYNAGTIDYPAAYEEVVAVSATNSDDKLANFSSYGDEVFIAAPGANNTSLRRGGGTVAFSGTSMASPHVAGAAAQLRAFGTDADRTRRLLEQTAEDIGLPEKKSGAGLLDVETALANLEGFMLVTEEPRDVCDGEATLAATVIQMGSVESATAFFEYRPVGADSWTRSDSQTVSSTETITERVSGIVPDTRHEVRTVVETGGEQMIVPGGEFVDRALVVGTGRPVADTEAATLRGTLDRMDCAEAVDLTFEYRDIDADAWTTTPTQTLESPGSVSQRITGLTEWAEYEYRLVAEASDGDSDVGETIPFTAADCVDPRNWPPEKKIPEYTWSTKKSFVKVNIDDQVTKLTDGLPEKGVGMPENGYRDLTCPGIVEVEPGGSFDVHVDTVSSGFMDWSVELLVDWNQDRAWDTAERTEVIERAHDDFGWASVVTVDVPEDAPTGKTLAQLELNYGGFLGRPERGEMMEFTVHVREGDEDETPEQPAVESLWLLQEYYTGSDHPFRQFARFHADWEVTASESDLSAVTLSLMDDTAGEKEGSATVDVSGKRASGRNTFDAKGDKRTGHAYTVELTVTDEDGNTTTHTAPATESKFDDLFYVENVTLTEVGSTDGDAEFTASFCYDGAATDRATLKLIDDTDGHVEDTWKTAAGGSRNLTVPLVAEGDAGSGHSYTAELTIESDDSGRSTHTKTASATAGRPERPPAIDSLSLEYLETNNADAEFEADWAVSDHNHDLLSLELTLFDADDSQEEWVGIDVRDASASDTTRLRAPGDAGSGEEYTAELLVRDRNGNTTVETASATAGESGKPPAVDSLSLAELEGTALSSIGDLSLSAVGTESGDAELEADWAVSDPDGDLSEVGLALTDDSDGTEEDTATVSVSGTSASDTTRLVAAGDDGSGHTYTVELSVTDSAGKSAADTASATIVDGDCVVEHFTGEDGDVGDIELLRAIRFWREDRAVPGCEKKGRLHRPAGSDLDLAREVSHAHPDRARTAAQTAVAPSRKAGTSGSTR